MNHPIQPSCFLEVDDPWTEIVRKYLGDYTVVSRSRNLYSQRAGVQGFREIVTTQVPSDPAFEFYGFTSQNVEN